MGQLICWEPPDFIHHPFAALIEKALAQYLILGIKQRHPALITNNETTTTTDDDNNKLSHNGMDGGF